MGIVGIERKLEEKRKEMDKNISEVRRGETEVGKEIWTERKTAGVEEVLRSTRG